MDDDEFSNKFQSNIKFRLKINYYDRNPGKQHIPQQKKTEVENKKHFG